MLSDRQATDWKKAGQDIGKGFKRRAQGFSVNAPLKDY